MSFVRFINKLVLGTPLEGFARKVYTRMSRSKGSQYEREILQVMKRTLKKESNCVDVGAYRGGVLEEILTLSPSGTHFAFEPIPDQYHYLVKRYSGAQIYPFALSDVVQEITFHHVVSRPTYSGFKRVKYPTDNERINEIKVQTERLDNIVPADLNIHFMKVDVEGAEFHVFRGGVETIRRSKPIIVFEHGLTSPWYYDIASADIYDLLVLECGLHISLMQQWLKGETPLSREAFVDEVAQAQNYYFIAHSSSGR